jgi:hypothetical protein
MKFDRDTNNSLYVEWEQAYGHKKRAWIQHRDVDDSEKNWAGVPDGRYLNVVRVTKKTGNPGGNATDFPIFCKDTDQEILEQFVRSVCDTTGLELKQ